MEEEIIQVDLLPDWLKKGTHVKVVGGKCRGNWGIINQVMPRHLYDDDEYRVRCHMPGVGDGDFQIKHLQKASR